MHGKCACCNKGEPRAPRQKINTKGNGELADTCGLGNSKSDKLWQLLQPVHPLNNLRCVYVVAVKFPRRKYVSTINNMPNVLLKAV